MIASMWSTRVGEPISPLIKKEKDSLLHSQKKNVSVQHAGSCNISKNRKMRKTQQLIVEAWTINSKYQRIETNYDDTNFCRQKR